MLFLILFAVSNIRPCPNDNACHCWFIAGAEVLFHNGLLKQVRAIWCGCAELTDAKYTLKLFSQILLKSNWTDQYSRLMKKLLLALSTDYTTGCF